MADAYLKSKRMLDDKMVKTFINILKLSSTYTYFTRIDRHLRRLTSTNIDDQNDWFWQNSEKFSKKFRILGVVTDFQIDFLNDSILFHTFCDLILIEQAKGFNLRYMETLRSLELKRYYVITKNLSRNRKFRGQKLFSENF